MIYTGNMMLYEFKVDSKSDFEMTYLGLMKYFLGIEVVQSNHGTCISQHKYSTCFA